VLRRRALVGDMLAHAALPGIGLAFLFTGLRETSTLAVGALVTGLLAILCVTTISRWTRIREDAALGIVLSTFFGAGVVLLSVVQQSGTGNQAGLDSFLFGEVAGIHVRDIRLLAVVAAAVTLTVLLVFKELQLVSFDPDFATSQGWPTFRIDLGILAGVALVTMVGLPICGVILTAAMLMIPSASARFWTDRLSRVVFLAAIFGASAGALGTWLASPLATQWLGFDPLFMTRQRQAVPPGPLIVLCAATIFLVSLCFAPKRGIIARSVAELRLRLRMQWDHLLRSLYELSEPHLPRIEPISIQQLHEDRHWPAWMLRAVLRLADRRGYVQFANNQVELTPRGLAAAAEVVRVHRLWELYLVEYAAIASDHVDRDADDVEHLLPPALVDRLEAKLASQHRLPNLGEAHVPASPHTVGPAF
jgi:manganese/zinc/iron transport system permease protein